MLKNQELANQIFEIMNTAIEASGELMTFLEERNMAEFQEVSSVLYQMLQSIRTIAEDIKKEEEGINLPEASESVLDSLKRIRQMATVDTSRAGKKIEFELIPLLEEMRVVFYYWGMVYPDQDKMKQYFEEDIHWLGGNKYTKKALETGKFKFDLSLVVVAYNKLEYTKQCVVNLLKNLPKKCTYEFVFVNHGSTDGTKEFFERCNPHKQLDISVNGGGLLALHRCTEGKYVVSISNDVFVTKNAIDNIYQCISSYNKIAWAVPSTSNVSNLQTIPVTYNNAEELGHLVEENNISNSKRWEQRVRLCNPIDILSAEFNQLIKPYHRFHAKNTFSFVDDKLSLMIRRNGYKMYLAKDAYCHHCESVTLKGEQNTYSQMAYLQGRKDFKEAYGVDPWDDSCCYSPFLFSKLQCQNKGATNILGINCGFGSNPLKIKEEIKEQTGNSDVYIKNITNDQTVIEDVKGVSDEACYVADYHVIKDWKENFDYIIAEKVQYKNLVEDIQILLDKVKQNGVVIICLKGIELKDLEQKKDVMMQCQRVEYVQERQDLYWVMMYK